MTIKPLRVSGPLFESVRFKDVKDPCIVFDGSKWHIYGSGGDVRSEVWQILHAEADHINGPWSEVEPVIMIGVRGDHVAAPSVFYDPHDKCFHMVVQTEFTSIGGIIEYLKSSDGNTFSRVNTALVSLPETTEAGIYDPHQAQIGNDKYLVYAGTSAVQGTIHGGYIIQPDVHLAKCECLDDQTSWSGPWKRQGVILGHDHISWHHNSRDHKEYEWGIEGPQIIELPNGTFLLNATCFLCEGKFGTRQRVFFAISDSLHGPYTSLGPVINPADYPHEYWLSGENGHASVIIQDETLYLFFQSRSQGEPEAVNNHWRYGLATFPLNSLIRSSS